jgi:pyruvate dehydrogenase complex dehydrogenase (E1) component
MEMNKENDVYEFENKEWIDSLEYIIRNESPERVQDLIERLQNHAQKKGISSTLKMNTPYINTIPLHQEVAYPGDVALEQKIENVIRWNAMAMVVIASGGGLSSYPHPRLMPDYWQFPTVSMGIGPISAIYQARFVRYLENHKLIKASDQKIFAFLGDGEMDDRESMGAITLASFKSWKLLLKGRDGMSSNYSMAELGISCSQRILLVFLLGD